VCPTPTPLFREADPLPLPQLPSVPPEMLSDDFVTRGVVIDMPVDYTIQLENVMDFDHGKLARCSS
jgi:hypothetical protein